MKQVISTKMTINEKTRTPQIIAKINGIDAILAIDLGSARIILDKKFAIDNFDLKITGSKDVRGIGENNAKMEFSKVNLQIADQNFDEVDVGIIDLSFMHVKIDGAIGYSLLKNYRVVLDYSGNQFSLEESEDDLTMYKFEYAADYIISVPTEINGEKLLFMLDSGASGNALSKSAVDKLGLSYREAEEKVQGVGGKMDTWVTEIDEIKAFGETFSGKDTLIIELPPQYNDGILGYGILKDSKLIIDYPAKRISLKK